MHPRPLFTFDGDKQGLQTKINRGHEEGQLLSFSALFSQQQTFHRLPISFIGGALFDPAPV